MARMPEALLLTAAILAFAAPLAWVVYLTLADPYAPVQVMGKAIPREGLFSWAR